MGMFDWVFSHYPLTNTEHNRAWYQTKNLDCLLERYVIAEDGRLWREAYFDKETSIEPCSFHGDIDLYHDKVLYRIRFVEGKVDKVALCQTTDDRGFPVWESPPFGPIPRISPGDTVPPVFPPLG